MTLHQEIKEELGNRTIERLPLPDYFATALTPTLQLRPYQEDCLRYFMALWHEDFRQRLRGRRHFLFHMATGSGKTLIMAGLLLMLYERGYRNVLFFVDQKPIIAKSKINFLAEGASKHLFNTPIQMGERQIHIREVQNFQSVDPDSINICFSTLAQLHSDLNTPKENAPTYEDFEGLKLVMIADEAHHINADTKRGAKTRIPTVSLGPTMPSDAETEESTSWEKTVERIHGSSDSILLEFTATMPLDNEYVREKYQDKLLYEYTLRTFREDGYSKDIEVVQRDLSEMDRILQALVLSQYKRKLFDSIRQPIKPVVFLKSKTKKANREIYEQFIETLDKLRPTQLEEIRRGAKGDVASAFAYFDQQGITLENLIGELREDFSPEKLILIDGSNDSEEKQRLLNTLEDSDNEIRAVFAVDMLKEGWDVLNLYDIVRLYDTRDHNKGVPGKTTVSEAQLIGRGARYMPFAAPEEGLPRGQRKYDSDIANPLRIVEKLHYHSAHNPRYIQELKVALVESGIIASQEKEVPVRLKAEFKESDLYRNGLVFKNARRVRSGNPLFGDNLTKAIPSRVITVTRYTGAMQSQLILAENPTGVSHKGGEQSFQTSFRELGYSVTRSALYHFAEYSFDILRRIYPELTSLRDFIKQANYLPQVTICVVGNASALSALSQQDKLMVAIDALKQLAPVLNLDEEEYEGSKEFKPVAFKEVFKDHDLKISLDGGDKELGKPIDLDLSVRPWHVYDSCIGTSEEKALVKYIDSIYPTLAEQYEDIYLVRNERDLKLYKFETGQAFEPDYLLFMKRKSGTDKECIYQIFIEPKGDHLLLKDKWKGTMLERLHDVAEVTFSQRGREYVVWGMPLYNKGNEGAFDKTIKETLELNPKV